jgi:hypothetical protein
MSCAPAIAAQTPPSLPEVTLSGCEGLDGSEVVRLLALEMPSDGSLADASGDNLQITCDSERVQLSLSASATDLRLERDIPAPDYSRPGAERVIALAASQLFATWLPLVTRRPAPSAERDVVVRPEPPRPLPPPSLHQEPPPVLALAVRGGVRARAAGLRLLMTRAELVASTELARRWRLLGAVAFEFGAAERDAGEVLIRVGQLGGGGGIAFWHAGRFHVHADVMAYGGLVHMQGSAPRGAYRHGSSRALAADLELSLGPVLSLDGARVGVDVAGGVMLPRVQALVEGEAAVSIGGPWIGGSAYVGIAFDD